MHTSNFMHTLQSVLFLVFFSEWLKKKKIYKTARFFPRAVLGLDSSEFFCFIYFMFG